MDMRRPAVVLLVLSLALLAVAAPAPSGGYRITAALLLVCDVVAAVQLAKERGLKIGIRSGGHSWAASFLRDGGMLLDLSQMNGFSVDVSTRTATAEYPQDRLHLIPAWRAVADPFRALRHRFAPTSAPR